MRRITDDAARDRGPMFTPNGRSLLFYSNRDGNWAAWTIGVDGGNLRRVAGDRLGAVDPQVSPNGDTIVFGAGLDHPAVYSAPLVAEAGTSPRQLTGTEIGGKYFSPTGWSPDGARLAGTLVSASGRPSGVALYDIAAGRTTRMSDDDAYAVRWLADNRRILYFAKQGTELILFDTLKMQRTRIDVRLPGPSVVNEGFAVSPDNRTIYYGAARAEADIWIAQQSTFLDR
jgi:TolB protein